MFKCFKRKRIDRPLKFNTRLLLIGLLFVVCGMIIISLFSVPVWLTSFRVLPDGALRVFFCYLMTVTFFFACGLIISYVYSYKTYFCLYSKKIVTDLIISYLLRLFWIIVFFGSNSFIVSVLCLCGSIVFLVFSVICTYRFSVPVTVIEVIMIVEELALIGFNIKFFLIN